MEIDPVGHKTDIIFGRRYTQIFSILGFTS